jgi:23S rRNA (cytosine1962-C5)-methyltransferase
VVRIVSVAGAVMARRMIQICVQAPTDLAEYALLDSGEGAKLERYGPYVLARPEPQAIWHRSLPIARWQTADAIFEKESGEWLERRPIPSRWRMREAGLTFYARLTSFRHTGVFPEQAVHWRWIRQTIAQAGRPIHVLDLFAYTALSTLAAAQAGARVTYVDASRPALTWARENQEASGLTTAPIRWILDDAIKFVRREVRRGVRYDAIIMDPPVFGRGPSGEVWRFYESVPILLDLCRQVLSDQPLFVLINAYAIEASSLMLANLLDDLMTGHPGTIEAGELVLAQEGSRRILPGGIYGKWRAHGLA